MKKTKQKPSEVPEVKEDREADYKCLLAKYAKLVQRSKRYFKSTISCQILAPATTNGKSEALVEHIAARADLFDLLYDSEPLTGDLKIEWSVDSVKGCKGNVVWNKVEV